MVATENRDSLFKMSELLKQDSKESIRNIIKTNIGSILLQNAKKAVPESKFFVTQINER